MTPIEVTATTPSIDVSLDGDTVEADVSSTPVQASFSGGIGPAQITSLTFSGGLVSPLVMELVGNVQES